MAKASARVWPWASASELVLVSVWGLVKEMGKASVLGSAWPSGSGMASEQVTDLGSAKELMWATESDSEKASGLEKLSASEKARASG